MREAELERFARHVSLAQIGVTGQTRLLATRIACEHAQIARALAKMGVQVVNDAPLRIFEDDTLMRGEVVFDEGIALGAQAFSEATHRDASAPRHMKERFFAALVASEAVLWLLGQRPARYRLHIAYPTYRVIAD